MPSNDERLPTADCRLPPADCRLSAVDCRSERGLSLVEATIILSVPSMLAAVMAPSIKGYVEEASQTKAKKDVEAIGMALSNMRADLGDVWFVRDGNGAAATDPPLYTAGNRVDLMVTAGNIPTLGVARAVGGPPDWDTAVDNASVQLLDNYLIANTPSNLAANAYRSAEDMSVLSNFDPDSGATYNSKFAWRGAYLPGPIGADPWGARYSVNVEFLAKALGGGPSGNVNDVLVLSAGSNQRTETRYDTDGVTGAGDDIIYVVSGSTR